VEHGKGVTAVPTPTFEPVDERQATGLVKEVFDEMKALRGMESIPPFWRAMALWPEYLAATWNRYKTVMMGGTLDPLTKEIIALAVSAAHNCDY
jgi:alkylhydroperoxidase/carboxymuconolactone decarboxylase family protein YurZ